MKVVLRDTKKSGEFVSMNMNLWILNCHDLPWDWVENHLFLCFFFINFFWKSFMTWMLIAQVPVGWHCIPTVSTMRWILILQMHCFLLFLWKCSVVFCRVRSAVFLSELHLHYFFSVSANQGLSLPEHKSFACLACVPNSVFLFYILFVFVPWHRLSSKI